jgi:hypothetical protein
MANLPPAIIFINRDITYPQNPPIFVGSMPNNPQSDASVSELTNLQIQLQINDTMSKEEFDARVKVDPNYPTIVHLQMYRILVILHSFHDPVNREYADVVMFLKLGMASVQYNRFGPPGQNYDIQRLNIYELLRAARREDYHHHRDHYEEHHREPGVSEVTIPSFPRPPKDHDDHRYDHFEPQGPECNCNQCNYPFFCDCCHTFSGMKKCRKCDCECKCGCSCGLYTLIDQQGIHSSPVHLPNCENEYHNPAFIHRK